MGERHEDALGLFADDVDLLDPWHMQQPLTQRFGVTHQLALWFTLSLQGIHREGHIGELVIDHRPDNAGRQRFGFITQLLASLVELFLHLRRRRAVAQRHHSECQARASVGFAAVVPLQLLHALL
ncbi:hypothetical protein D3C77_288590 [compost metagenome]